MEEIGYGPVCLDTCVFIYFIEENSQYIEVVSQVFEAINNGHLTAVTSGITLIETLVVPLRAKDFKLANRYRDFLTESEGLLFLELDQYLLYQGAVIRAQLSIKTPDALQIAAAQSMNCKTFITNDRRLPKIPGLKVLQLSDFKD